VKWNLGPGVKGETSGGTEICLEKILETRIPLNEINAHPGDALEIRASIWQQGLPVDALPAEGRNHVTGLEGKRIRGHRQ